MDAAMAKRFATDSFLDVAKMALQLLGGYGYLREYPIEQALRDLKSPCHIGGQQRDHAARYVQRLDKQQG
jgi:alkylation response protein AidB-like acyl-CoA dehydrogenase